VLDGEISGRVLAVSPISGEGCHNHSVLESDCADLDGLKKLGCGHCNASACFRDLLGAVVPVKSSIESSFIQQFTTITGCQYDGIDREARYAVGNEKLHSACSAVVMRSGKPVSTLDQLGMMTVQ
jgi:hypothetical protein